MVGRALGRLARALRDDAAAAVTGTGLRPAEAPPPGLRTYLQDGTRLQLRVQRDGTGLLFVDVNDVAHLSVSAAFMAFLVLEALPPKEALRRLRRRFVGVPAARLEADLQHVARVIAALRDPDPACRTCAADLPQTPLFASHPQAPHKVDLALTYACNNRCPHCYNPPERFGRRSLEPARWLEVLGRLAEIGVPHVLFTGGEPTLHPALPALVRRAAELGMVPGLITNGRRLADRAFTAELRGAGLDHVQVTLESHRREVHDAMVAAGGAFEETVAGIRAAVHAGLHVLTNTTLTRQNLDHADALPGFVHGLGLRTFAMNGLIRTGGGAGNADAVAEDALAARLMAVRERAAALRLRMLWYTVTRYCAFSPLELELGAKRCNAGEYSMCVEPDGEVLPCQSYYRSAGHILDDPWEAVWDGELFRSFRHRTEAPYLDALPRACATCPDLAVCAGGCPLERADPAATCREAATTRSSGGPAIVQIGETPC